MSSVLPSVLFLVWFIRRAAAQQAYFHTPFSILKEFFLIRVLSIQILSKIAERQSSTESLTTFKMSTNMFSTIDQTLIKDLYFTTTTSFQETVTTLSLHNQISTPITTSLQHLK